MPRMTDEMISDQGFKAIDKNERITGETRSLMASLYPVSVYHRALKEVMKKNEDKNQLPLKQYVPPKQNPRIPNNPPPERKPMETNPEYVRTLMNEFRKKNGQYPK